MSFWARYKLGIVLAELLILTDKVFRLDGFFPYLEVRSWVSFYRWVAALNLDQKLAELFLLVFTLCKFLFPVVFLLFELGKGDRTNDYD